MSKRGGARLFVAAEAYIINSLKKFNIWKFKGGENNSRGGKCPNPLPPKYTPACMSPQY